MSPWVSSKSSLFQLGLQYQCLRGSFVIYQHSARMGQFCLLFWSCEGWKALSTGVGLCPWSAGGKAPKPLFLFQACTPDPHSPYSSRNDPSAFKILDPPLRQPVHMHGYIIYSLFSCCANVRLVLSVLWNHWRRFKWKAISCLLNRTNCSAISTSFAT